MVKREFTFPSADGKTAIHAVEWLPEGAPRAVLQIAHGVSEYVLRYEDFAGYLTERGFAVVGNDQAIEPWLDEALTDYLRVIQEEYEDRSLTRSDESLRLLAEQMKQTKQYGG